MIFCFIGGYVDGGFRRNPICVTHINGWEGAFRKNAISNFNRKIQTNSVPEIRFQKHLKILYILL
jgi:hypothetical protein